MQHILGMSTILRIIYVRDCSVLSFMEKPIQLDLSISLAFFVMGIIQAGLQIIELIWDHLRFIGTVNVAS